MGTCAEFMAAWKSEYKYCLNCIRWDSEDLVCMDTAEVARRRKIREFDFIDKSMRSNKPIDGDLCK